MANEKRLIDANALEAVFKKTKMSAVFPNWANMDIMAKCAVIEYAKKVKSIVTNAPTVDAVEVVRCKDCRRCEKAINAHAGMVFKCNLFHPNDGRRYKRPNDFCSYGERREGE